SQHSRLQPGTPDNEVLPAGLSTPIAFTSAEGGNFSIRIKAKGSGHFYFTPVGRNTVANLKSDWKNPAFDGKQLPNTKADVSDKGFSASWRIQQAARTYPQQWANSNQKLSESSLGVRLIQPADSYAKTERSVKYSLLFISLTFAVFFFIELLLKKQVHPLQYLLVGIALTIFYSLLLSISEYVGFNRAYAIASVATVSLIGLYVWSMFKQLKIAAGFTLALAGLYAYIFFLIQLLSTCSGKLKLAIFKCKLSRKV
ncbi:MAG: cell envelope integrity protein CreD, partial [Proteobacteria bacterium]